MAEAKCTRCGGFATGDTFEEASSLINHAVGLSRSISCGSNYNKVVEIKPAIKDTSKPTTEKPVNTTKSYTSKNKSKKSKSTTESSIDSTTDSTIE